MKNGRRRDKRGLQNFSGAPHPLIKPPNSVPVHQKFASVGKAKSQRDRLTLHQPIRLRPQRCIQRCISQKAYHFLGAVPPHPTTAQHTQQHTAHTRAKPTNLSPAGRLGGTPTAHKRETCHRHSRGRLVDPRTQLHRTRPQGQKLGPKDRISCGPANLATSSNPRRQVGSSRGFGGIPLHLSLIHI